MRQYQTKPLQTLILFFYLFIPANLHSAAVAQFPWDKVAATGIATLAGYFAKFEYDNPAEFPIAKATKFATKTKQSPLSIHLKTDLLLSPIYQANLIASKIDITSNVPAREFVINMARIDFHSFNRAVFEAYDLLSNGDFYSAKQALEPFKKKHGYDIATFPGRNATVERLFQAFQANFYNDYNILSRYQDDPLWSNLPEKTKRAIASDATLRFTMNLELVLRHEMLIKLQHCLGLTDLNYKGLKPFLFSFMCLSPQAQLDTLLKMLSGHDLFKALYNHNGILRAFNSHPYTSAHTIPTDFNNLQMRLYTKRMNELLYYNLQTKDKAAFQIAAAAIAEGLRGNLFYAHLPYSYISPILINDLIKELGAIALYADKQSEKPKLPIDQNQLKKQLEDPNDPDHIKLIMAELAAASSYTKELVNALNERLIELQTTLGRLISVVNINLRHTFHGNFNAISKTTTGCHSYAGKCCFNLEKVHTIGKETPIEIVKVIRDGIEKTSSIFPWTTPKECMENIVRIVRTGQYIPYTRYSPDDKIAVIRFFDEQTKIIIELRIDTFKRILDSIYPGIK